MQTLGRLTGNDGAQTRSAKAMLATQLSDDKVNGKKNFFPNQTWVLETLTNTLDIEVPRLRLHPLPF